MSEGAKKWVAAGLVTIAVLGGLYGLQDVSNIWIALAAAALVLLVIWRRFWLEIAVEALPLIGAAVVGVLALVGVNIAINFLFRHVPFLEGERLPITIGLGLASVVFGLAVFWYLHRAGWSRGRSKLVAFELAFVVIVAVPFVVGRINAETTPVDPPESVAAERAPSGLDLILVGDGSSHGKPPQLPPNLALGKFDATYSVGYADGDRVRWTLVAGGSADEALAVLARGSAPTAREPAPVPRADADTVLLLLVDGTRPVVEDPSTLRDVRFRPGEVRRWRQLAGGAVTPQPPTFALLQTKSKERLRRWRHFGKPGSVVSFQALGSQTATDAAVRLAVAAPTAEADFALALKYRPVLLFDQRGQMPLSVVALFREHRISLCHDRSVSRTECDSTPLGDPAELKNGGTHLRIDHRDPEDVRLQTERDLRTLKAEALGEPGIASPGAPPEGVPPPSRATVATEETVPGQGTTIYVHPVSVERGRRELLYLDYWWYLPDNPVALGGGALCGAGLVIAGVTCPNHESDWEGMTVIVDRTNVPRVVAVQYAQHASTVRYDWQLLRRHWDHPEEGESPVEGLVEDLPDWSTRPLAFIAAGTHATYPTPCGPCKQVAATILGEDWHRGGFGWVGNYTATCGRSSCLQLLPTREQGAKPALWNDYDGPWGDRHCVFTYYCDSATPPKSPGHQGRYRRPTEYDGYVGKDWRFHEGPEPAAALGEGPGGA